MSRWSAWLCLGCAAASAQSPPVFKSETEVVLVDAVVTNKKGEYVRDLSAKDFRVFTDGKQQAISSFSLQPASDPLRLILFFDNSSMSVSDQIGARNAAASFVDAVLASAPPSSRLIAAVSFDGELHVAQNFTADAARLKNAIHGEALSNSGPVMRNIPPNSAGSTIPSLINLAQGLSAAPGRKAVVLFTSANAFAGAQNGDLAGLVQLFNRARAAVYPVLQTPLPGGFDPDTGFNPGGGRGRGIQGTRADAGAQDGMPYTLASDTGGFVVPPSNDPLPQLRKIAGEQEQSYLLGFSPPAGDKAEACHSLRVKVDVSGATLLARSSYCASKPQDLLAESRVEQDLEKHAAAPQAGASTALETPFFYVAPAQLAGTTDPGAGGNAELQGRLAGRAGPVPAPSVARVHAVMEIPTASLKFEMVKGKQHAEINVLGLASSGSGTAARFSDIVKRDFESQRDLDAFRRAPLRYEKEFKIVPGEYTLTVVFSSGGATFGKAETSLKIPARETGQLAVSGLALGTEVRPAGDLGLEASLLDQTTPLVATGMQLIPAGEYRFAKSSPVYGYFEVYPGESAATVRARILDQKTETVKWDGGEAKLDAGGKAVLPVGLSLPVEPLAPGVYQLIVTARDSSGHSVERIAAFTIQ